MYPYIIGIIIVAIDQLIKVGVIKYISIIDSKTIIPGILNFTYLENRGVAFGLFSGGGIVFILLSSVILVAIVGMIEKSKNEEPFFTILLAFIMGGAVGNLIDRIRFGYVVDFIHFTFFPYVFNFADSCVVIGSIVLAAYLVFLDKGDTLFKSKGIL